MNAIEADFPALLETGYLVTSEKDDAYNCFGWVTGRTDLWIDPAPHYWWPDDLNRGDSVSAFIAMYQTFDFEPCGLDDSLEDDLEKIAIYGMPDSAEHAARQLTDGRWTSKLGPGEDIEHPTLDGLAGDVYGTIQCVLKRSR